MPEKPKPFVYSKSEDAATCRFNLELRHKELDFEVDLRPELTLEEVLDKRTQSFYQLSAIFEGSFQNHILPAYDCGSTRGQCSLHFLHEDSSTYLHEDLYNL